MIGYDEQDRDAALAQLRGVTRQIRELQAEKDHLRDQLVPALGDEPHMFLDDQDAKMMATVVTPQTVTYDLALLHELVDQDLYDEVTKTVVDTEAFKEAAAAGRIHRTVVAQVCQIKDGTPYVRFGDPTP